MRFTFVSQTKEIPTMTEKFKKIERPYVLSDSSVNEYGFRLLTSGYDLAAFQKNPIGYYMHRREDGIVLKWEDLHVEDDKVVGTPVINLSNEKGEQICSEAENGFLNAASVGHVVVLEYSTEPEMMLPGQTGPTITKWYNKECSLVDIPGNRNALIKLYDAQENEINLVDISGQTPVLKIVQQNTIKDLCALLNLAGEGSEMQLMGAVQELVAKCDSLAAERKALAGDVALLQLQLTELAAKQTANRIGALLDNALEDKKITVELRNKLQADYANNAEGLKDLLGAMPAYRSIAEMLQHKQSDKAEAMWQWDDYEKNDASGKKLRALKANDPARYKELFDQKFNPAIAA
jgi:hypothetical protein